MAIQLHSWPRSSGTRIAWALEELGVAYDYVEVDAKKGEHRAARHLALHPQGKVPALVDGDVHLFESCAILVHLGEALGIEKKLWPAAGGQARADALSWTIWSLTELGAHMMQYVYHGLDSPVSYKPEQRSKAAAEYSLSQFARCLDALETRLDGREHVLGDFSLVDITPASMLMFGTMLGVTIDRHARTAAWLKRCTGRPALARAR